MVRQIMKILTYLTIIPVFFEFTCIGSAGLAMEVGDASSRRIIFGTENLIGKPRNEGIKLADFSKLYMGIDPKDDFKESDVVSVVPLGPSIKLPSMPKTLTGPLKTIKKCQFRNVLGGKNRQAARSRNDIYDSKLNSKLKAKEIGEDEGANSTKFSGDVVGFAKTKSQAKSSKDTICPVNLAIASSNNITISSTPSGVMHVTQSTSNFLPESTNQVRGRARKEILDGVTASQNELSVSATPFTNSSSASGNLNVRKVVGAGSTAPPLSEQNFDYSVTPFVQEPHSVPVFYDGENLASRERPIQFTQAAADPTEQGNQRFGDTDSFAYNLEKEISRKRLIGSENEHRMEQYGATSYKAPGQIQSGSKTDFSSREVNFKTFEREEMKKKQDFRWNAKGSTEGSEGISTSSSGAGTKQGKSRTQDYVHYLSKSTEFESDIDRTKNTSPLQTADGRKDENNKKGSFAVPQSKKLKKGNFNGTYDRNPIHQYEAAGGRVQGIHNAARLIEDEIDKRADYDPIDRDSTEMNLMLNSDFSTKPSKRYQLPASPGGTPLTSSRNFPAWHDVNIENLLGSLDVNNVALKEVLMPVENGKYGLAEVGANRTGQSLNRLVERNSQKIQSEQVYSGSRLNASNYQMAGTFGDKYRIISNPPAEGNHLIKNGDNSHLKGKYGEFPAHSDSLGMPKWAGEPSSIPESTADATFRNGGISLGYISYDKDRREIDLDRRKRYAIVSEGARLHIGAGGLASSTEFHEISQDLPSKRQNNITIMGGKYAGKEVPDRFGVASVIPIFPMKIDSDDMSYASTGLFNYVASLGKEDNVVYEDARRSKAASGDKEAKMTRIADIDEESNYHDEYTAMASDDYTDESYNKYRNAGDWVRRNWPANESEHRAYAVWEYQLLHPPSNDSTYFETRAYAEQDERDNYVDEKTSVAKSINANPESYTVFNENENFPNEDFTVERHVPPIIEPGVGAAGANPSVGFDGTCKDKKCGDDSNASTKEARNYRTAVADTSTEFSGSKESKLINWLLPESLLRGLPNSDHYSAIVLPGLGRIVVPDPFRIAAVSAPESNVSENGPKFHLGAWRRQEDLDSEPKAQPQNGGKVSKSAKGNRGVVQNIENRANKQYVGNQNTEKITADNMNVMNYNVENSHNVYQVNNGNTSDLNMNISDVTNKFDHNANLIPVLIVEKELGSTDSPNHSSPERSDMLSSVSNLNYESTINSDMFISLPRIDLVPLKVHGLGKGGESDRIQVEYSENIIPIVKLPSLDLSKIVDIDLDKSKCSCKKTQPLNTLCPKCQLEVPPLPPIPALPQIPSLPPIPSLPSPLHPINIPGLKFKASIDFEHSDSSSDDGTEDSKDPRNRFNVSTKNLFDGINFVVETSRGDGTADADGDAAQVEKRAVGPTEDVKTPVTNIFKFFNSSKVYGAEPESPPRDSTKGVLRENAQAPEQRSTLGPFKIANGNSPICRYKKLCDLINRKESVLFLTRLGLNSKISHALFEGYGLDNGAFNAEKDRRIKDFMKTYNWIERNPVEAANKLSVMVGDMAFAEKVAARLQTNPASMKVIVKNATSVLQEWQRRRSSRLVAADVADTEELNMESTDEGRQDSKVQILSALLAQCLSEGLERPTRNQT